MNDSSSARSGSRGLIWKMLGALLLLVVTSVMALFLPIWDIPAFAPPNFPAPESRTPEQARFREALRSIVPAKEDDFPFYDLSFLSITHETTDTEKALRFYGTYHDIVPLIPGLFDPPNPETAAEPPVHAEYPLVNEGQICSKLLLLEVHTAATLEEQVHWSILHLKFARLFAETAGDSSERADSLYILRDALESVRFLQKHKADIVATEASLREALLALPVARELAIQSLEETYRQLDPALDTADLTDFSYGKPNPAFQQYHWIAYLYQPQRTRKMVLETVLHEREVLRGLVSETSENPIQKQIRELRSRVDKPLQLFLPGTWRNAVGTLTCFNLEPYFSPLREYALQLQSLQDELLLP